MAMHSDWFKVGPRSAGSNHSFRYVVSGVVRRILERPMTRWIELILPIMAAMLTAWSMIQTNSYRLDKLEDGFEKHLEKHEIQQKQFQETLYAIQRSVDRLVPKQP